MQPSIILQQVPNVPIINQSDDLAKVIVDSIRQSHIQLSKNDIICVASKVVSITENRLVNLDSVRVSDEANKLHENVKRKDPKVLQLILDEANNDLANVRISDQWIGARTKIGRVLTSAGIDKVDEDTVLLLPVDPDGSAKKLGEVLKEDLGVQVSVLITDSDGREDIAGATQICIGTYGLPPIRKQNGNEETVCDMLAAAAGLVMGQRGNNVPVVIIHDFDYVFDVNAKLMAI